MPYLTAEEMLAFNKAPIPYRSPTGVSDYDAFDDNLMYESLPPDHLFKLIENLNWRRSIVQLNRNKRIARQWVINKGTRRLPLHEACVRKPPDDILCILLEIYPDGAKAMDSSGRYPIHHACANAASAQIIFQLLYAFPEGVDTKDNWDKTPKEYYLNSTASPDVKVIQALFDNPQKSNQMVLYNPSEPPAKATSPYQMEGLSKALEQSKEDSYLPYVQPEKDKDYYCSRGLENKTKERIDFQSVRANSRRDIDIQKIGQRQHVDRKAAQTIVAEVIPQKYAGYAEATGFEHDLNGLSHMRENLHYNSQLSKVNEDTSAEVMQLKNKIKNLETQVQCSRQEAANMAQKDDENDMLRNMNTDLRGAMLSLERENKRKNQEIQLQYTRQEATNMAAKNEENDMLRNINKDLRGAIISLSKKLNTVTKELDSAKVNSSATNEMAGQLRHLQSYQEVSLEIVRKMENEKAEYVRTIDKLNDEIEELNSSYFDVTNALVEKSKDYFTVKAELDKINQINNRYYHS